MLFDKQTIVESMRDMALFKATSKLTLPEELEATNAYDSVNAVHPILTPQNIELYIPPIDSETDTRTPEERRADFLNEIRDTSIIELCNSFIMKKVLSEAGAGILYDRKLFIKNSSILNKTANTFAGKKVGFRFEFGRSEMTTHTIKNITFQGDVVGTFNIYLMNSTLAEPVETYELEYTTPNVPQTFAVNFKLQKIDEVKGIFGGVWFLGYNKSDYAGNPINAGIDYANLCPSCGITYEKTSYGVFNKYMSLCPVSFTGELNPVNLELNPNQNFGLNFKMKGECDYTNFITQNKSSFESIVKLWAGIKLIEYIISNPSGMVNRGTSINADKINQLIVDLEGSTQLKSKGLRSALNAEFDALSIQTQGFDFECFKNENKGKMRVL